MQSDESQSGVQRAMADQGSDAATAKEEVASSSSTGAAGDAEVDTTLARSIARQIEYYFSDANFPKDKFLMAEVAKSAESWVQLSVIAKFNKIIQLVPILQSIDAITSEHVTAAGFCYR